MSNDRTDSVLAELLSRATGEELGLLVETNNPIAMQTYLQDYRKRSGDPRYDNLIFSIPALDGTVFIHRRLLEAVE